MAEQKKTPSRPLPKLTELDTRAFWLATKDHELNYPQCNACDAVVFYPRRHCTACGSDSLTWKTASGRGRVYSYSVVRQSYHPFFRSLVPYVVAWIDLEEGPRLVSNVVGVDVDAVQVGQEVMLTWEDHDEVAVPLFTPA